MENLRVIRMRRYDSSTPWGFRLQGGRDFNRPLAINSVQAGSVAERCGMKAGDHVFKINDANVENSDHEPAKMEIIRSGNELSFTVVQVGGESWKPQVQQISPGSHPSGPGQQPVYQQTSLAARPQEPQHVGSGHNRAAGGYQRPGPGAQTHRPHPGGVGGGGDGGGMAPTDSVPVVVHAQYNSPAALYSKQNIADSFKAQTEGLVTDMTGGQGESVRPPPQHQTGGGQMPGGMKSVHAPQTNPNAAPHQPPAAQGGTNCWGCGAPITGVFVRVKGNPMHADCFKCSVCSESLRNQGYYYGDGNLFCRSHAGELARPSQPTNIRR